jgi:peptide/nickel transport system permease protein
VYRAVQLKDIPVLTGAVVCVALFFAVVNTAVDLSYRVLDPRVRSV